MIALCHDYGADDKHFRSIDVNMLTNQRLKLRLLASLRRNPICYPLAGVSKITAHGLTVSVASCLSPKARPCVEAQRWCSATAVLRQQRSKSLFGSIRFERIRLWFRTIAAASFLSALNSDASSLQKPLLIRLRLDLTSSTPYSKTERKPPAPTATKKVHICEPET